VRGIAWRVMVGVVDLTTRYETRLVRDCLIPMSDGVVLAADLYRNVRLGC
jgi:predicted acyl esterase